MRKPFVMSVCMIVKDEEANLERCLNSLQPVLEQVSSELIIVDTGSTDKTVEIARRYTDKVYFHEWNNNFSDMRNISISYAQGEWIFIFDADEQLDDPEGLLKLLRYEKLGNFNTVRFQAKNILSYANPKDIFHITERLFRNDGEFCYVGSVHNQPRFKHPILNTDVLINHYGYNNDDPELMDKKFKRTSALLLQELEKDPDNIYYLFQLARSYLMHKDLADALDNIKKAYQLVKQTADESVLPKYYYVFGEYVRTLYYNEKFEKCIEVCEETLALSPQYIDIWYYKATSYYRMNKMEEAVGLFEEYLQLYDDYMNNKLDMTKFSAIEMHSIDPKVVTAATSQVVDYYFNKERYEDAFRYVRYMDERRETCLAVIRILLKLKIYDRIALYYRNLKNKDLVPVFIICLENELKSLDPPQIQAVSSFFAPGDDRYAQFNAIRAASDKSALIRQFIEKNDFDELPLNPYSQVMIYAIESGVSLNALLKKMKDGNIRLFVQSAVERSEDARSFFEQFVQTTKVRANDFHSNRIIVAIGHVLLLTAVEKAKRNKTELPDRYAAIVDMYLHAGVQYVTYLYQTHAIRMIYRTMDNKEHQFYLLIYLAMEALNKGLRKNALEYYKEAAEGYPYFANIVKQLIENITTEDAKQSILESIEQDIKPEERLKVFQGTIEIANQMALLTNGLKQQNVCARSLNYYPNYLKYQSDYTYDIHAGSNQSRVLNDIEQISLEAIENFDVFHFHFATSLRPDFSDLPLLKQAKKPVLMHYWGSEVRMLSIARKWNPYVVVKFADEEAIKRKLACLASMIDHCVVADYELYQYVKEYHNNIHFIKQIIDTDKYRPLEGFRFRKKKPVVVHAPTSPEVKGTKYVLQAVEELKHVYDFEFMLIRNKSHEEARLLYQQADIVVDQLLCGSYGILALESMAMGKPVITYINEHVREHYPQDLPIVSANPDTVKDVLLRLLKDWELRGELGTKGRRFVEEHHEARIVSKQFIYLYTKIKNNG